MRLAPVAGLRVVVGRVVAGFSGELLLRRPPLVRGRGVGLGLAALAGASAALPRAVVFGFDAAL